MKRPGLPFEKKLWICPVEFYIKEDTIDGLMVNLLLVVKELFPVTPPSNMKSTFLLETSSRNVFGYRDVNCVACCICDKS